MAEEAEEEEVCGIQNLSSSRNISHHTQMYKFYILNSSAKFPFIHAFHHLVNENVNDSDDKTRSRLHRKLLSQIIFDILNVHFEYY